MSAWTITKLMFAWWRYAMQGDDWVRYRMVKAMKSAGWDLTVYEEKQRTAERNQ